MYTKITLTLAEIIWILDIAKHVLGFTGSFILKSTFAGVGLKFNLIEKF